MKGQGEAIFTLFLVILVLGLVVYCMRQADIEENLNRMQSTDLIFSGGINKK